MRATVLGQPTGSRQRWDGRAPFVVCSKHPKRGWLCSAIQMRHHLEHENTTPLILSTSDGSARGRLELTSPPIASMLWSELLRPCRFARRLEPLMAPLPCQSPLCRKIYDRLFTPLPNPRVRPRPRSLENCSSRLSWLSTTSCLSWPESSEQQPNSFRPSTYQGTLPKSARRLARCAALWRSGDCGRHATTTHLSVFSSPHIRTTAPT